MYIFYFISILYLYFCCIVKCLVFYAAATKTISQIRINKVPSYLIFNINIRTWCDVNSLACQPCRVIKTFRHISAVYRTKICLEKDNKKKIELSPMVEKTLYY
ncbi:hypothetical protein KUCAC02_003806 [Chaenocephalus aceratus]|uniref:Uncharacterized protein n=1 Tax=Chaenocephalus aceratus TaxID=36190 RepID=A0ACB9WN88_CHAAC|nr:hypothetical protein KUCAC02_003806 [Chaenocephalus aceratus]